MLGPIARISRQFGQNIVKNTIRNHSHGGIPGENLPFRIDNRYRFTGVFFVFVGSGIAAPFIILIHQMRKS